VLRIPLFPLPGGEGARCFLRPGATQGVPPERVVRYLLRLPENLSDPSLVARLHPVPCLSILHVTYAERACTDLGAAGYPGRQRSHRRLALVLLSVSARRGVDDGPPDCARRTATSGTNYTAYCPVPDDWAGSPIRSPADFFSNRASGVLSCSSPESPWVNGLGNLAPGSGCRGRDPLSCARCRTSVTLA
jgi:hypothetical protein